MSRPLGIEDDDSKESVEEYKNRLRGGEMTKEYKRLGTIEAASFGFGGHDGATLGITFVLNGGSWSVQDFWGSKSANSHHIVSLAEAIGIQKLLEETGKTYIEDLAGTPIEITLTGIGGSLKSWRVAKAEKTLEEKFKEYYRSGKTLGHDYSYVSKQLAAIAKQHYEKDEE